MRMYNLKFQRTEKVGWKKGVWSTYFKSKFQVSSAVNQKILQFKLPFADWLYINAHFIFESHKSKSFQRGRRLLLKHPGLIEFMLCHIAAMMLENESHLQLAFNKGLWSLLQKCHKAACILLTRAPFSKHTSSFH